MATGQRPTDLAIRNRQTVRRINRAAFRRMARGALHQLGVARYELAVHFVSSPEITRLNEQFLRHGGPTDVITFDHALERSPGALYGEIFICVDVAVAQAPLFHTSWPTEIARYFVHGVLHLLGFDDRSARRRRQMKHEEDTHLRQLRRDFSLRQLAAGPPHRRIAYG